MGCGTSFVKYVLFFFNFLFAIAGLALVGIGVATILKVSEITQNVPKLALAPWVAIVIGAIIFVIAFFGCCGAVRESHCMVVTYAIFLLVIIIIQVVLAILLFLYRDDVINVVDRFLNDTFERAKTDKANEDLFNTFEAQLECCGLHGASDYFSRSVPNSCCSRTDGLLDRITNGCNVLTAASRNGCLYTMRSFLTTSGNSLAGVAIGTAIVEVVGAIFALCLANSIRNMDRRSHY